MQIDFLKALGLLLIILAHVKPGYLIMQLRLFDVPLMVLISGYLAEASYQKCATFLQYYKKRVLRLYLPTAIFLSFFFLCCLVFQSPFPFPAEKVYRSYLLLSSRTIGYVWIIRVFLLCMLMTPLLIYYKNHIFSWKGLFVITALYGAYELVSMHWKAPQLITETLFYAIPYGSVLILGMLLHKLSRKNILLISSIFGCLYAVMAIYLFYQKGEYVSPQNYKYSPHLYFLSFSICVSYFLYAATINLNLKKWLYNCIYFISRNSFGIYLWHIFFLYFIEFNHITMPWYCLYAVVLALSCAAVYSVRKLKAFWL